MHQVGNHQADGERTAGNQGAGRQVRLVVQLLHSLEHTLPGFLADVLVVPEDLRDGHDGHAQSRAMSFIRTAMSLIMTAI